MLLAPSPRKVRVRPAGAPSRSVMVSRSARIWHGWNSSVSPLTTGTVLAAASFYKIPPEPEFRRGVIRRTEDLTMWVKFHPNRVPARVWRLTLRLWALAPIQSIPFAHPLR